MFLYSDFLMKYSRVFFSNWTWKTKRRKYLEEKNDFKIKSKLWHNGDINTFLHVELTQAKTRRCWRKAMRGGKAEPRLKELLEEKFQERATEYKSQVLGRWGIRVEQTKPNEKPQLLTVCAPVWTVWPFQKFTSQVAFLTQQWQSCWSCDPGCV